MYAVCTRASNNWHHTGHDQDHRLTQQQMHNWKAYLVTTYYRGGMATISQTTYTWMHDGAIRAALMTYRIPSQNRLRAGRCECYVGLPAGSSKWGSISSC
jgi:hypothetical protein